MSGEEPKIRVTARNAYSEGLTGDRRPFVRFDKYAEQEIWFTTDLKTHNYNEEGKRFIVFDQNGTAEYVDLNARFGLGKERADWELMEESIASDAED